jgi:hypothetical protein
MTLAGRRLLLVAAGTLLAVVLAFVVGVGIGRGKGPADGESLARRAASSWRLRGRPLPRVGRRAEDYEKRVVAELERCYPDLKGWFRTEGATAGPNGSPRFRVVLHRLSSQQVAEAWQGALLTWPVDDYVPFENAQVEPE